MFWPQIIRIWVFPPRPAQKVLEDSVLPRLKDQGFHFIEIEQVTSLLMYVTSAREPENQQKPGRQLDRQS